MTQIDRRGFIGKLFGGGAAAAVVASGVPAGAAEKTVSAADMLWDDPIPSHAQSSVGKQLRQWKEFAEWSKRMGDSCNWSSVGVPASSDSFLIEKDRSK